MKVFIETYGCSANVNDSEIIAGLLAEGGHQIVAAEKEADAIVVNTCTVKGPTEAKIRSRIKRLQSNGKRLIVAGCMAEAQTATVQQLAPAAAIVGTHKINEIVGAVEGKNKVAVGNSVIDKPSLPKVSVNSAISIVQINEGCLGSCTFCITKIARGNTVSYPMGSIRNSVADAVQNGSREIWLTSQDTGTYGLDRRASLPELLQQLCNIDGNFQIRVGMMNPTLASHLLQPLIDAFKNGKVFKFLHIPLQAGSNNILAAMKRGYNLETFRKIVDEFRRQVPHVTIATDIICGFPSETEKDFTETFKVIEEIKPEIVNVSRFWPRPGTPAAVMKPLPDKAVMERSRRLHSLAKVISFERNREWVGWSGKVIVDEKGKVPGTFAGRNFAYKPIIVSSEENLIGKIVAVKVTGAAVTHLKAALHKLAYSSKIPSVNPFMKPSSPGVIDDCVD